MDKPEKTMETLLDNFKELLTNFFHSFGWAWWVEIVTQNPHCTYYFGPFLSEKEAKAAMTGYVEDLQQEKAQGIAVNVKRCKPDNLTISDDLGEMIDRKTPLFSGQM